MANDIRIAHLPARTPYARKIVPPGTTVANTSGEDAAVPVDLTFAQLARGSIRAFDILHVHSIEFADRADVVNSLALCHDRGQPVVVTVHDLIPMFDEPQRAFDAKLDCVCRAATAVVTLTGQAAAILRTTFAEREWLQRLEVIPHGWSIPPVRVDRGPRSQIVQYAMFGAFRPNRDVWTALVNWYYALQSEPAALTLLCRAFDPGTLRKAEFHAVDVLNFVHQREPRLQIIMRPHPTDDDVREFMRSMDVLVLPYTFGTHSGQLELAIDTGVLAVVSDTGCFREQVAGAGDRIPQKPVWFDWSDGAVPRYAQRFSRALIEAQARAALRSSIDLSAVGTWRTREHNDLLRAYGRIYEGTMR